jgi:hypothetical protein
MVYGLEFIEIFLKESDSDIRFGDTMKETFNLINKVKNL